MTAAASVALLLSAALAAVQPQRDASAAKRTGHVGVLYPGADNSIFRDNFDGFRRALGAAGYVEGRNLTIDVLSLNLATARALGVTISPDLMLRADEVFR